MTEDSIRRIAMRVMADQQSILSFDDKNELVHLLGFNYGVLTLAEKLIDSLVESQTKCGDERCAKK